MIVLLLILAIAFGIFYSILTLSISGIFKLFLAAIEMLLVGQFLIWRYKLTGEHGLILLKSKRGLELINKIAKHEQVWKFFSDAGTVVSYGLLSLVITKKNVSIKGFVSGIALISILFFFVAPFVLPFLVSVIGISVLEHGAVQQVGDTNILAIISIILLYAGGFFTLLLASIIGYGTFILSALLSTLLHGTQAIAKTSPGATFLLPGVNIPFWEGIAALVVILIVHEGAHAVLARIARIPVLSSGVVLFGIIPIGAFVEPDEEKLKKLEQTKQTRVLIAGSMANLLTSIIFFVLFIGLFFTTAQYREEGLLVTSGMEKNTVIHAVNGQQIDIKNFEKLDLPKNSEVKLDTNKGEITRKTNEEGKLGITIRPITRDSIFGVYNSGVLQFIYMLLGLTFALNFVIGTVNLLPLPFFDGYRTLEINIQNKHIVKSLMAITLAAFLVNFLPWFFRG